MVEYLRRAEETKTPFSHPIRNTWKLRLEMGTPLANSLAKKFVFKPGKTCDFFVIWIQQIVFKELNIHIIISGLFLFLFYSAELKETNRGITNHT